MKRSLSEDAVSCPGFVHLDAKVLGGQDVELTSDRYVEIELR